MVLKQIINIAVVAVICAVVLGALAAAPQTQFPPLKTLASTFGSRGTVVVAGGGVLMWLWRLLG
jgi:hypothetical protein